MATTVYPFHAWIDQAGVTPDTASEIIRPDADISIGSWTDNASGTTNIYLAIDETSPSETDYIQSSINPTLDVCEIRLSNETLTNIGVDHRVSYRYQKSGSGGRTIELRVRLLQGATEIASWTHSNISDVIAQADQTLSGDQTALITDYDDLRLEFRGDVSGSGAGRRAQVSWAEVEVNAEINTLVSAFNEWWDGDPEAAAADQQATFFGCHF